MSNTYKEGSVLKIMVGGLPNLSYINQPRNVEEHEFTTPKIPHKSEILFYDLPKKQQYWRRVEYPDIFYTYNPGVTELTDPEIEKVLIECIRMDKERRMYGVWFMNNGIPTYITGHNYFHLQWGDMINGLAVDGKAYPDYRRFQRDFFYFIDICEKDNDCLGGCVAKAKKVGVTQMMASIYCDVATLEERQRLGCMSKNQTEVVETNMAMMDHIINNLPMIITPKRGKTNIMEILFGHPRSTPKGTKQFLKKSQELKEQKVLNSIIIAKPTKVGAMDGPKYNYVWFDEMPKYYQSVKISPKALFEKDSAAVKLQQQIIGKCFITAYTPEVDDIGFEEAKKIYYDSQKITIKYDNVFKRTKSNLYCYHISALYATEGTFDIYGEADVEYAFKINQEERDNAKDDLGKLQALIRQGARHHDESWMSGSTGSTFDNVRLQQSANEKERKEFTQETFYTRGNLQWTGQRLLSHVKFVPDKNGKWYITKMLPAELLNQWMMPVEGKDLVPYNNVNFVSGTDPFSYMDIDGEGKAGSKGASYVMAVPNSPMDNYFNNLKSGDTFSKRIISWYCERPASANEFLEDMVMQTLYFGCRALVENNKEWVTTRLKEYGLKKFLLYRNSETNAIEKYNYAKASKLKEKSTLKGTVDELARVINEYLLSPQEFGDPDYCFLLEDIELINQLMNFDPLNTKKFDRVMAFGYTLLALNSFSILSKIKTEDSAIDMNKVAMALLR